MTSSEISEIIKNAIITGNQILITYKYGIGDNYINQLIHPYILGSDFYQYDFVWAYFPYRMVFYKYQIEKIKSVSLTDISYTVLPEAVYQYAIEEEHYAVVLGFCKIYVQQSIPIADEGKTPLPSAS
jgi:hypothetical protein